MRAASLWFWAVLGVAIVSAGFLLAGGVNLLLDLARGIL